jgi:hypothetical protein
MATTLPDDGAGATLKRFDNTRVTRYTEVFLIGGDLTTKLEANVYNTYGLNDMERTGDSCPDAVLAEVDLDAQGLQLRPLDEGASDESRSWTRDDDVVIWAILALLGVPLWLCAIAILTLILHNRRLRKRPGNVPIRVLRPGKTRWSPGHGLWVSDVFAWRGRPAAWREDLVQVSGASARAAEVEERKKLHRIGDDPVVATFKLAEGGTLDVATAAEHRSALLGPFAAALTDAWAG